MLSSADMPPRTALSLQLEVEILRFLNNCCAVALGLHIEISSIVARIVSVMLADCIICVL
jgi:hypothetical protein